MGELSLAVFVVTSTGVHLDDELRLTGTPRPGGSWFPDRGAVITFSERPGLQYRVLRTDLELGFIHVRPEVGNGFVIEPPEPPEPTIVAKIGCPICEELVEDEFLVTGGPLGPGTKLTTRNNALVGHMIEKHNWGEHVNG